MSERRSSEKNLYIRHRLLLYEKSSCIKEEEATCRCPEASIPRRWHYRLFLRSYNNLNTSDNSNAKRRRYHCCENITHHLKEQLQCLINIWIEGYGVDDFGLDICCLNNFALQLDVEVLQFSRYLELKCYIIWSFWNKKEFYIYTTKYKVYLKYAKDFKRWLLTQI